MIILPVAEPGGSDHRIGDALLSELFWKPSSSSPRCGRFGERCDEAAGAAVPWPRSACAADEKVEDIFQTFLPARRVRRLDVLPDGEIGDRGQCAGTSADRLAKLAVLSGMAIGANLIDAPVLDRRGGRQQRAGEILWQKRGARRLEDIRLVLAHSQQLGRGEAGHGAIADDGVGIGIVSSISSHPA